MAPLAIGATQGIRTGMATGNPLAGLTSGVGAGAGAYVGSNLLGPTLGSLGGGTSAASGGATPGFLGAPLAKAFGDTALEGPAQSAFGSATGGNLIGGAIGQGVGQSLTDPMKLGIQGGPSTGSPAFAPSRSGDMQMPGDLSQYSGLNPNQQATNIATRGVYGQGNGPQDNQYFTNLINHQLIDPSGNVAGDNSSINPVESQYLSQIGLGGYGNPKDLLQKISNYAG